MAALTGNVSKPLPADVSVLECSREFGLLDSQGNGMELKG